MTIATQALPERTTPQCPRCGNKDGIHTGGGLPGRHGHRAYDIYSDTFGMLRCPHCGLRSHYAEFHKTSQLDEVQKHQRR